MRIEDVHGNPIADPDLSAGRLEEAVRMTTGEDGTVSEETLLVYFEFESEAERAAAAQELAREEFAKTAPSRLDRVEAAADDVLLLMADMLGGAL